jgi:hypothetical protein
MKFQDASFEELMSTIKPKDGTTEHEPKWVRPIVRVSLSVIIAVTAWTLVFHSRDGMGNVVAALSMPLLIACLILVTVAMRIRDHKRTRSVNNFCPECGYDLRATPHRCPECGHVPATK